MKYIYENNTNADLVIPKIEEKGNIQLKIKGQFVGSEKYLMYVKPPLNLLKFVSEVKEEEIKQETKEEVKQEIKQEVKEEVKQETKQEVKEEVKQETKKPVKKAKKKKKKTKPKSINKNKKEEKMEEKLILEQPEKIELNKEEINKEEENKELNEEKEILLTEQPVGDMEIIKE